MGIIYDGSVEEKELYKAYGLTAYGKINRYVWTIHNEKEDKCIIALRITDIEGKNIIDINLGNNCIMYDIFDGTIDNFLYWISTENPDKYMIEKQVFRSLCQSDCSFNHRIASRKFKERQQKEMQKKIKEKEVQKQAALDKIKEYCQKKDLIFYYDGWKVYLLKALTNKAEAVVKSAIKYKQSEKMEDYICLAEEVPENKDLRIVQCGEIQEINIEH